MLEIDTHDGPARREAAGQRDGAGNPVRAGGHVLALLSKALNGLALRALAGGPMRLADLRREVGGPAQTTLRGNLCNLIQIGALEKRPGNGGAGMVDNALTPAGCELLFVDDVIVSWLARAPQGPIRLESETGKAAIKALVRGWDSTMLRALAIRPLSLTELDNLISSFSYPSLERRLGAMRLAGLVSPSTGSNGGTPYVVTEWLRQGMAPLLAALRCERRHMASETAPLTRIDIETILLLAVPLVAFAPDVGGVAQLAVYGGEGQEQRSAGVRFEVEGGHPRRFTSKLDPRAENCLGGSAAAWLDALVTGDPAALEFRGDAGFMLDIIDGLHRALFIS